MYSLIFINFGSKKLSELFTENSKSFSPGQLNQDPARLILDQR